MNLCRNKKTDELLVILIESKPFINQTRTLNLAVREDGTYVAIGDDEIEYITEDYYIENKTGEKAQYLGEDSEEVKSNQE